MTLGECAEPKAVEDVNLGEGTECGPQGTGSKQENRKESRRVGIRNCPSEVTRGKFKLQAPDAEVPGASALGSPSFLAASLAWQLGRCNSILIRYFPGATVHATIFHDCTPGAKC